MLKRTRSSTAACFLTSFLLTASKLILSIYHLRILQPVSLVQIEVLGSESTAVALAKAAGRKVPTKQMSEACRGGQNTCNVEAYEDFFHV